MSLLIKGVTKLSQLAIDAVKNWAGMRIDNVGAPDSDDDVPRRDTIDGKITTHAGIAAAHHAKTTIADLSPIALADLDPAVCSETEAGTIADGKITTHETGAKHRWTDEKLLKGAGAGADPTEIDVPAGGNAKFGDGSDGNITLGAPLTLTRDMFYNNLTTNGHNVTGGGYRIFVKETLTNTSTIQRNGNNAVGRSGGVALIAGTLGIGQKGGDGPGGGTGGGAGGGAGVLFIAAKLIVNTGGIISANGGNGSNGDPATARLTGENGVNLAQAEGGAGGLGGTCAGGTPGVGGTVTVPTYVDPMRTYPGLMLQREAYESTANKINGGAGGGGGASDGAGNGGGGGGGGGGLLVLIYNSLATGTETANGGTGGAGVGGSGTAGTNGAAGEVIKVPNA